MRHRTGRENPPTRRRTDKRDVAARIAGEHSTDDRRSGERGLTARGARAPGRPTAGSARRGRDLLVASVIFLAALATRLGFLSSTPDGAWPHSVCFEGDAPLWVRYAASLQRGEPFEFDLPIHTPGLAYLLRWTGGASPTGGFVAHKVVWCLLGAASCVLTWLLACRVFTASTWERAAQSGPRPSGSGVADVRSAAPVHPERIAVVAGLLAAASFALTVQATSINNETPYTFLLLLIALLTLRVAERPTAANLLILAALHGVAVLFRAEHTLLFVALGAYLAWRWRRATAPAAPHGPPGSRLGVVTGLAIIAVGFFLVPLPWNIRSYRAIQRFNTVEPRPIDYASARVPWAPDAVEYVRGLPAFAREGNFLRLTDLAAAAGVNPVTREFVEHWFRAETGYVPRPMSPWTFVSNQGPLCFALANHANTDGGFSTALLDEIGGPTGLSFGYPPHLQVFQQGYRLGLRYWFEHRTDAPRLLGRKLAIFGSGLTQGLTPLNVPLGVAGLRRPADQFGAAASPPWVWPGVLFALAAIGTWVCLRHRVGSVLLIVVAQKVVIALLFFGYVRQAASIFPFFAVLVALGLEVALLAPLLRRRPRLAVMPPILITAAVAAIIGIGAFCATRDVRYDVFGGIDHTPQWGPGAFESHQPLTIRQVGPTP